MPDRPRRVTRPDPSEGSSGVPGEDAEHPREIPARGWLQIAKRGWAEAKADNVPLLSAGVAFYAFLALFPALVALVSIYGLFADPAAIAARIGQLGAALPEQARALITDQVTALTSRGRSTLGVGAVVSILVALFSASGGVNNLMTAINLAYDEEDDRGAIRKRLIALGLTVGAIVLVVLVLALAGVLPPLLENLLGQGPLRWLLQLAGLLVLIVLVSVALAVLFRVAPHRDAPKIRWVSVGAVIATVIWLLASLGFSLYVSTLGNYAKTYGVFAGIVVLLFWLWLTAYAVLLGAEINAESEQQTAADTTRGPAKPLGRRGAVKADSLPG